MDFCPHLWVLCLFYCDTQILKYRYFRSTSITGVPNWDWAAQQEVNSGRTGEASRVFPAAPHRPRYCLSFASCQISSSIRFS